MSVKRIADSTVRRLSMYLRYLEDLDARQQQTASSDELAQLCHTTPAQVRKDLSFFGSFGKRGLGYPVHELSAKLREILGLKREWKVVIIGAGKIGAALANYRGFRQRGFRIAGVYDNSPDNQGRKGSFVSIDGAWAEACDTPLSYFKMTTSEGGVQVSLIVKGPGMVGADWEAYARSVG